MRVYDSCIYVIDIYKICCYDVIVNYFIFNDIMVFIMIKKIYYDYM